MTKAGDALAAEHRHSVTQRGVWSYAERPPAILMVDDFVTMRRILRNVLRQLGYDNIVEATDGMAALQILGQQDIDLVLTDMHMPRMSGLELLKAIRAEATLHALSVLLITAEAERDTIVEAIRLGVHGYIASPLPHVSSRRTLSGFSRSEQHVRPAFRPQRLPARPGHAVEDRVG